MITHKFFKHISLRFVFLVILFVISTACHKNFEENITVENPNSDLLTRLIQITDFSSNWQWIYSDVSQSKEIPTTENDYLIEKAAHGLTGLYGDERLYIRIFHILEKSKEVSGERTSSLTENMTSANIFTLAIDDIAKAECNQETSSHQPGVIFCETTTYYTNLTSIITVYAPDIIEDESLIEIFNEALSATDKRVQEMQ